MLPKRSQLNGIFSVNEDVFTICTKRVCIYTMTGTRIKVVI